MLSIHCVLAAGFVMWPVLGRYQLSYTSYLYACYWPEVTIGQTDGMGVPHTNEPPMGHETIIAI